MCQLLVGSAQDSATGAASSCPQGGHQAMLPAWSWWPLYLKLQTHQITRERERKRVWRENKGTSFSWWAKTRYRLHWQGCPRESSSALCKASCGMVSGQGSEEAPFLAMFLPFFFFPCLHTHSLSRDIVGDWGTGNGSQDRDCWINNKKKDIGFLTQRACEHLLKKWSWQHKEAYCASCNSRQIFWVWNKLDLRQSLKSPYANACALTAQLGQFHLLITHYLLKPPPALAGHRLSSTYKWATELWAHSLLKMSKSPQGKARTSFEPKSSA